MSGNVIALPTRAVSFYSVSRSKDLWAVVLVSPIPGKRPIRTMIAWHCTEDMALVHGREVALRLKRPFKLGRSA